MSKENDRQEYWDKEVNKAKAELASLTKQREFYDQPNGNYGAKEKAENEAKIEEAMRRLTVSREMKKTVDKG